MNDNAKWNTAVFHRDLSLYRIIIHNSNTDIKHSVFQIGLPTFNPYPTE
jgi:hypothetical protein